MYAVAVYADTCIQSSTCMYSAWTHFSTISRVSFMFIEHDGKQSRTEKPEIRHDWRPLENNIFA